MNIDRIKIVGFKSVADITLEQLKPYSVFAGPNGAGKSNLTDALEFVGAVIESGAVRAIRKFNGFAQIHCYKFKKQKSRTFEFSFDAGFKEQAIAYTLKIYDMDTDPKLEERLLVDGKPVLTRKKGEPPKLGLSDSGDLEEIPNMPVDVSALMFTRPLPLYEFLTNIQVFRFDPLGAKEPDASSADTSGLDSHGHNVATMLAAFEKDTDFRTQVTDWMELLVPGMEKVGTEQQRLDGRTVIKFKELGT
jgi:predicted ATPase